MVFYCFLADWSLLNKSYFMKKNITLSVKNATFTICRVRTTLTKKSMLWMQKIDLLEKPLEPKNIAVDLNFSKLVNYLFHILPIMQTEPGVWF